MDDSRIAFKGTLQQLLEKVEQWEMIPKLQASHAPPCKFWTAFQVINGIRHMAPVIHGPRGCTYSVASNYKMRACEYRGVPLEPTSCTAQDEADVVYGGEGKLLEAVKEENMDIFCEQVGKAYKEKTGLNPEFYIEDIGDGTR